MAFSTLAVGFGLEETMEKSLFKSKTFWINVVLAFLPLFPGVNEAVKANPEYLGFAFGAINALLRLISKDKVYLA